jgi:DNA-binding GntR family transcriptional regulator
VSPSPARNKLSDKIRQAIEADIASGQLSAGARIDEQALMDRFEVSRTPAREALLQLVSAGLLTSVPRQGAVVATLSVPDYIALLEVLTELEGLAARLSARRMPAEQRRQLEAADRVCREVALTDDAQRYREANRSFHELIYDGSLNEVLARQLREIRLRIRSPQNRLFDSPGRIRNSVAEHQLVLQAILDGNEEAAYRSMTGHILKGGNVYTDAIASLPYSGSVSAPLATLNVTAGELTAAPQPRQGPKRSPPAASTARRKATDKT